MKKIIRRVGTSVGIIFNKEEQRAYNLIKDSIVDIEVKTKKHQGGN